jgi:hypothetical protein
VRSMMARIASPLTPVMVLVVALAKIGVALSL